MKTVCSMFAVLLLAVVCSASSTVSLPQNGVQAQSVDGPAPVPICPPEEGWCETMPSGPKPHQAEQSAITTFHYQGNK